MPNTLYAIGVGESVKAYEDKLPYIFKNYHTITVHNGLNKLYEKYGLLPKYYTWGDPFGSLYALRFLDNLTEPVKTIIIIPETQTHSYDHFRKHHGTTRCVNHWEEYLGLIDSLTKKGFTVLSAPNRTPKEKFPTLKERFSKNHVWMGSLPHDGDRSEDRNAAETQLTRWIFPLAHYMNYEQVNVLGFDCIGGRFYDTIEGTPQQPWPDHQLPMLVENLKIWNEWKPYHNMELVSVVEDSYTINNKQLKYQPI